MHRGCGSLLAISIVAVVLTIGSIVAIYPVYAEIDAAVQRAQVSADATKMADRLDEVLFSMENRGVTQGHAAIIFRNPQTDVGLDYEAISDLRDRARRIAEFDTASVEYQVGLDDMRGTLREIDINAWYFAAIRSPMVYLGILLWILFFIVLLVMAE